MTNFQRLKYQRDKAIQQLLKARKGKRKSKELYSQVLDISAQVAGMRIPLKKAG